MDEEGAVKPEAQALDEEGAHKPESEAAEEERAPKRHKGMLMGMLFDDEGSNSKKMEDAENAA